MGAIVVVAVVGTVRRGKSSIGTGCVNGVARGGGAQVGPARCGGEEALLLLAEVCPKGAKSTPDEHNRCEHYGEQSTLVEASQ